MNAPITQKWRYVDAMLTGAASEPVRGRPDPPTGAEPIRSDRGLELDHQWHVTFGKTIPSLRNPRNPRGAGDIRTPPLPPLRLTPGESIDG